MTDEEVRFQLRLTGVTFSNDDGTNRQDLLKRLRRGSPVQLKRDYGNPTDPYAVAVFTVEGQQLGWIPAGDRLGHYLDSGGTVSATVKEVMGGPGLLGLFFQSYRKSYGCVVVITKHGYDWNKVKPYVDKSTELEQLAQKAEKLEKDDPKAAITHYRQVAEQVVTFDEMGIMAAAWRRTRHPVNRLSLLLEKGGDLTGAYAEIEKYEKFTDRYGLTAADQKSVATRKQRLAKKLKKPEA